MKCPKCHDKLYAIDVVKNTFTGEIYHKRQCKKCNRIVYTVKFEVTYDDTLAKGWNKFYRHKRKKGDHI